MDASGGQFSCPFGKIMNELIALDVMNYHDENHSQTHSLVAPAYSTKETRKYLNFTLDIHSKNMDASGGKFSFPFGQIMNELIALDVMNYHDENRSQKYSLAAPAYSTKDTGKYLNFTLGIHIQKYGHLWWQIFFPFRTNNV